ncbi:hypothetical protein PCANC_28677 [Puccinia coronata f. sp. avenae]|uniref:Uncharacterized protein n=1 Tax=Puccinia coronata f. sp. avenae TaxID=200324 RepID=A0A2N5TP06_9BASI|nr:hypothetical protein PCANC_28677 [Puccinia coronata f. sp. avenae]
MSPSSSSTRAKELRAKRPMGARARVCPMGWSEGIFRSDTPGSTSQGSRTSWSRSELAAGSMSPLHPNRLGRRVIGAGPMSHPLEPQWPEWSAHRSERSAHRSERFARRFEQSAHRFEQSAHRFEQSAHRFEQAARRFEQSARRVEQSAHRSERSTHRTEQSAYRPSRLLSLLGELGALLAKQEQSVPARSAG